MMIDTKKVLQSVGLNDNIFENLKNINKKGIENFEKIGVPIYRKNELWKYTDISKVFQHNYKKNGVLDININTTPLFDQFSTLLVFKNDIFDIENSKLNNSIKVSKLSEIDDLKKIENYFSKFENREDQISILNQATFSDGVVIEFNKDTVLKDPIYILNIVTDQYQHITPRNFIHIDKNSEVKIFEEYRSDVNTPFFINGVTSIVVDDNSKLEHYKFFQKFENGFHISSCRVILNRDAKYNSFTLGMGSPLKRENIEIYLSKEGAETELLGISALDKDHHFDTQILVDHIAPHTTSKQLFKNILNETGKAIFNGRVVVEQDAQKVFSDQLNNNLLLSEDSTVYTKPQLEIGADDVKCTHGATTGQLNKDEIFYLQTRGISEEEAIKMLSKGFLNEVIFKIDNENIRDLVFNTLLKDFWNRGEE